MLDSGLDGNNNRAAQHRLDDLLLAAGEQMDAVAYERFVTGHLSREVLEEVHRNLSEWRRLSLTLLELIAG